MKKTANRKTRSTLPKGFRPGTFGFHEMVDRACLVAELFSEQIAGHPAAEHPKLRKRIKGIENALFELYRIAAVETGHL